MFGRTLVVLLLALGLTAAPASAKRGPINTKVTVAGKAASAQITVASGGSISENTLVEIVHTPEPPLPLPPAE